ncbi:MAG: hypothetical protein FWE14_07390 [Lachnospiraceae bacterium]|nr:hypothetical protein [Lachnospiraceae bacterium]
MKIHLKRKAKVLATAATFVMLIGLYMHHFIPVDATVGTFFDLSLEVEHFMDTAESEGNVEIQVAIPTTIDFYLDPLNVTGLGTIFSPDYSIINYSNVDVILEISGLAYSFSDNGSFMSYNRPLTNEDDSYYKNVFMFLRHIVNPLIDLDGDIADITVEQLYDNQNDDFIITDQTEGSILTIILKAANYDDNGNFLSLNEDSIFLFSIMGDITSGENEVWKSGDLKINMVYSWKALIPDNANTVIDDTTSIFNNDTSGTFDNGNDDTSGTFDNGNTGNGNGDGTITEPTNSAFGE